MDYNNIDTYISNVKDEQIIKDYLETGIFRLDTNHRKVMSTKLHQDMSYIISPPTDIDNITDDIKIHNLMNDLNKIEAEIKLAHDREIKEKNNENECPICMDNMGDNNYIVPYCKHKVCIPCFIRTVKQNNKMCNNCCLCREKIIS
jgi:hypothetical protein